MRRSWPRPHRGERNEPAFVRYTAKVLAEVKGVSEAEVDKVTTANFFTLFSKAKPAGAPPHDRWSGGAHDRANLPSPCPSPPGRRDP